MRRTYAVILCLALLLLVSACSAQPEAEAPVVETTPEPEQEEQILCTLEYAPVCGEDGETYGNACQADAAGVNIVAEGECQVAPTADLIVRIGNKDVDPKIAEIPLEDASFSVINERDDEIRVTIPQLEIDETIPQGQDAYITIQAGSRAGYYPVEVNYDQVLTLRLLE